MTFAKAAELVLRDASMPLTVKDLWAKIAERNLVESAGATPEATLAADLLRRSRGSRSGRTLKERPFYKAAPSTFGLVAWLSQAELEALDTEAAIEATVALGETSGHSSSPAAKRAILRASSVEAKRVLDAICGSGATAEAVSRALADRVRLASSVNPKSWSVTLKPKRQEIALNVGRGYALHLREGGAGVGLSKPDLTPATLDVLSQRGLSLGPGFEMVPDSAWLEVPIAEFTEVWPLLRDASQTFTRKAAESVRRTPYLRTHSPGVVELLRERYGEEVPDAAGSPERTNHITSEFELLFDEFQSEYVETAKGEEHVHWYARGRQRGLDNVREIEQALARGEDTTDAVLLKLLPHNDFAGNRQRGAWVHIAPAITKDLKAWFEGAGWTKSSDWPVIAKAIWNFVQACKGKPDDLAAHCQAFAALPYAKGFQSGMLTPILNAIAPERYFLINSKSIKALNHFTGQRFDTQLVNYPAANAALHSLVTDNRETLSLSEHSDVRPGDLFDTFSHWLIGVRRSLNVQEALEQDDEPSSVLFEDLAGDELEDPVLQETYTRDMFLADTALSGERLDQLLKVLQRKKQLILQGPPGTGKTYVAERLAKHLVSNTDGIVETVQFHSTYAYEDFMRGLRPRVQEGGLSYEWEDGRFVRFCRERALGRKGFCVLIIDEINRADLGRVFGELMYLLEYRTKAIPLTGGDGLFSIPDNVLIIGTMNTADRSIARLDHALRRRFSFVRLGPEYAALTKRLTDRGLPAKSLVETLQRVNKLIGDPNYELGISYFMRDDASLKEHLPDIWQFEIESYLEEYFYDQPAKLADFRWQRLRGSELKDWT